MTDTNVMKDLAEAIRGRDAQRARVAELEASAPTPPHVEQAGEPKEGV